MTVTEERSYIEAARREKLRELEQRGIQAFAYRFERTHTSAQALAAFEDDREVSVAVAGRILSIRDLGKSTFMHVGDRDGRIQLYVQRNVLGDERYQVLKLLDISDHIGVRGVLFRTRAGEVTVRVTELELLSKSLRPLPFGKIDADGNVHGGLTDPEARYRQRYADLAVHPEVRELFVLRARIISYIRRFLDDLGFVEVETPVLQPIHGGAAARPFVTHHNALDTDLYLRIADELYLKRCIVGGLEAVYEIGHDFRNEGIDRLHNPEFTMLEYYQAYADYEDMMRLLEDLLSGLVRHIAGTTKLERFGQVIDLTPPWARKSYVALVQEHAGVDILSAPDDRLRALLHGEEEELDEMARTKLIDEIFSEYVEPHLIQPTIVQDYPIEISPLAKPKRGNPKLTERFELYVDGAELANAFSELNDPDDQRRRFEGQLAARDAGDDEAHVLDEDYVRALEYGLPPTGGLGLGIDRVVMLLAEKRSIREVILFPSLRPETDDDEADG
jgi:lysyl-tRNA synthetase class 2